MINLNQARYAAYRILVEDLLLSPALLQLSWQKHHYGVSRMQHCIQVSYYSYILCKKLGLNARAAARAGLLHDLFHYQWNSQAISFRQHAKRHPKIALKNARHITNLSPMEEDIILSHMWLSDTVTPRYRESYIVSLVDKFSAVHEAIYGVISMVSNDIKSKRKFKKEVYS